MGFLTTPVEDELIAESKRKRQEEELKRQKEREAMDMLATFRSGDTPKNSALDKGIAEQMASARYAQSSLPLPPIQSQDPEAEAMQQAGMGRGQVPRATGIFPKDTEVARIMSPDYQQLPNAPDGFEAGGVYSGTQAAKDYRQEQYAKKVSEILRGQPEDVKMNLLSQLAQGAADVGLNDLSVTLAQDGLSDIGKKQYETSALATRGIEDTRQKGQQQEQLTGEMGKRNTFEYGLRGQEQTNKYDREMDLQELRNKGKVLNKGASIVGTDENGEPIYGPDKTDFTQEQQLRTQLSGRSKDFIVQRDAYSRIKNVATGGAMSDISIIYQYMKMNDPGSTVREGEFATAQNAASVPDRIRNMYNKVAKGERLNSDQRKEILDNAKSFYNSAAQIQRKLNEEYSKIGKGYGLSPERITAGFEPDVDSEGTTVNEFDSLWGK